MTSHGVLQQPEGLLPNPPGLWGANPTFPRNLGSKRPEPSGDCPSLGPLFEPQHRQTPIIILPVWESEAGGSRVPSCT